MNPSYPPNMQAKVGRYCGGNYYQHSTLKTVAFISKIRTL